MKKSAFIILSFLFAAALSAGDMLVNVAEEPEGANCENGGVRIDSGEDTDASGTLDESEVTDTQYVCNGADGENGSSPAITITDAGETCGAAGGIKIEVGGNVSYVCNGADGKNALSRTSEEAAGANCENGGVRIEVGVDSNANGVLDDSEVIAAQTKYACNGADGSAGNDALAKVTEEPKGENCPNSTGIKIEVGIDSNGNGTLDESEVTNTQYVCNGKNGYVGPQGEKGDQGEPGVNGTDGEDGAQGEKGDQGAQGDQGEQGEQGEAGEDGANGAASLVSVVDEPAGENCASGGKKISVGLDANGNGTLDEDEMDPEGVYYVCNGLDAEEAGLSSSSTGCSLSAVEETDDDFFALFAMISAVLAFIAVRFSRA